MAHQVGEKIMLKMYDRSSMPSPWATEMLKYCGGEYIIESIDGTYMHLHKTDGFTFSITDIVEKEEDRLEIAKKLEEKRKKLEEDRKTMVYSPEEVQKLAESVFTEERVYVKTINSSRFEVYIHFPEIEIKNSKERKHIIRDLYTVIDVNIYNLDGDLNKCEIHFNGFRSSITIKEFQSHYMHSHLGSSEGMRISSFCLGSSMFRVLVSNLQMTLQETDWMMLLLSIRGYLEWESLEGGPYNLIENLAYSVNIPEEEIEAELHKVMDGIPKSIWNVSSSDPLTRGKAELVDYLDGCFPIKSHSCPSKEKMEKEVERASKNFARKSTTIQWKGKNIIPRVIVEDTSKKEVEHISRRMVQTIENILSKQFNQFLKIKRHEREKQKYRSRIFQDSYHFSSPIGEVRAV